MLYLCHKCKLISKDVVICPHCNSASHKSDIDAEAFYTLGYIDFRLIPTDLTSFLGSDIIFSDKKKGMFKNSLKLQKGSLIEVLFAS